MNLKVLFVSVCMSMSMFSFGQHIPTDSTTTEEVTPESSVQIFAPNAFTPDGDYYNDTWRVFIEGIDIYDFHLTIFNRSGEVVWESFNSGAEWDGTYSNMSVPDGVYPWIIETKDAVTDKRYQFTGYTIIIR